MSGSVQITTGAALNGNSGGIVVTAGGSPVAGGPPNTAQGGSLFLGSGSATNGTAKGVVLRGGNAAVGRAGTVALIASMSNNQMDYNGGGSVSVVSGLNRAGQGGSIFVGSSAAQSSQPTGNVFVYTATPNANNSNEVWTMGDSGQIVVTSGSTPSGNSGAVNVIAGTYGGRGGGSIVLSTSPQESLMNSQNVSVGMLLTTGPSLNASANIVLSAGSSVNGAGGAFLIQAGPSNLTSSAGSVYLFGGQAPSVVNVSTWVPTTYQVLNFTTYSNVSVYNGSYLQNQSVLNITTNTRVNKTVNVSRYYNVTVANKYYYNVTVWNTSTLTSTPGIRGSIITNRQFAVNDVNVTVFNFNVTNNTITFINQSGDPSIHFDSARQAIEIESVRFWNNPEPGTYVNLTAGLNVSAIGVTTENTSQITFEQSGLKVQTRAAPVVIPGYCNTTTNGTNTTGANATNATICLPSLVVNTAEYIDTTWAFFEDGMGTWNSLYAPTMQITDAYVELTGLRFTDNKIVSANIPFRRIMFNQSNMQFDQVQFLLANLSNVSTTVIFAVPDDQLNCTVNGTNVCSYQEMTSEYDWRYPQLRFPDPTYNTTTTATLMYDVTYFNTTSLVNVTLYRNVTTNVTQNVTVNVTTAKLVNGVMRNVTNTTTVLQNVSVTTNQSYWVMQNRTVANFTNNSYYSYSSSTAYKTAVISAQLSDDMAWLFSPTGVGWSSFPDLFGFEDSHVNFLNKSLQIQDNHINWVEDGVTLETVTMNDNSTQLGGLVFANDTISSYKNIISGMTQGPLDSFVSILGNTKIEGDLMLKSHFIMNARDSPSTQMPNVIFGSPDDSKYWSMTIGTYDDVQNVAISSSPNALESNAAGSTSSPCTKLVFSYTDTGVTKNIMAFGSCVDNINNTPMPKFTTYRCSQYSCSTPSTLATAPRSQRRLAERKGKPLTARPEGSGARCGKGASVQSALDKLKDVNEQVAAYERRIPALELQLNKCMRKLGLLTG